MIENTTQRDKAAHLLGILTDGNGYIPAMEAAGQAQLVASEQLPTDAPWGDLEDLGFVPGEPVEGDDLFRHCTLPEGWKITATDHAMWSAVLDTRGIKRVSIFYKAAFYDRKAFARLARPGSEMCGDLLYGDDPVALPEVWPLLTEEERGQFTDYLEQMESDIQQYPDIYDKHSPRVTALRALLDAR